MHTPGPWHIGTPPPNGEQTIGTCNGLMVAVATTGHKTPATTIRNAKLIAAAPELLSALVWMEETFRGYESADGATQALFKQARAAIKKALQ